MKPWEETWVAEYASVRDVRDRRVLLADWRGTGDLDNQDEVARLAAQAPAMARVLLDLEWRTITFSDDPWCITCERQKSLGHKSDCALVTVLRAAGVIE